MQLLFKYLYLHLIEPECAESIDTKDQLSIVSWGWMKSSCGRKEHNHITEKRSQGGPVLTVIFGQWERDLELAELVARTAGPS